jgi:hypothetical protein
VHAGKPCGARECFCELGTKQRPFKQARHCAESANCKCSGAGRGMPENNDLKLRFASELLQLDFAGTQLAF